MTRIAAAMVLFPALASGAWISIRGQGVELFTDAGPAVARQALRRMAEFDAVYRTVYPGASEGLPLRVVIYASASGFAPHRRGHSNAGFYLNSGDRDWIVVEHGSSRVLAHEYAHRLRTYGPVPFPPWLEEGLAEFYSTLTTTASRAQAGGLIPGHARTLSQQTWLPLRALLDAPPDGVSSAVFYAQSWAFVHMLLAAPYYRERAVELLRLLEERVPAPAALEQAYGKTLAVLEREFKHYVSSGGYHALTLPYPPPRPAGVDTPRTLSTIEVSLLEGEIYLAGGRQAEARRIYERIARTAPANPAAQAALGTLALGRKDYPPARDHLRRALDGGFTGQGVYLEYAMLLRETGGSREEVRRWLQRAVEHEPQLGDAHFLLGSEASLEGKPAEAATHFSRALRARPRRGLWWYSLALAQRDAGQFTEARTSLYRAMDFAASEQEREAAETLLAAMASTVQRPSAAKPPVTIHPAWNRPDGDQTAEGKLAHVDCRESSLGLHVETPAGVLKLLVEKPGEIAIRNAGAARHEFHCGAAAGDGLRIRYFSKGLPDGYQGSITSIEWTQAAGAKQP